MVVTLRRLGRAASMLIWIVTPSLVAAQSQESPNSTKKFVFLLPDGFKGWMCVDFGVVGAPPRPREVDALVIRPRKGEVLSTSDKTDALFLYGEAWFEVNGERRPLPNDMTVQAGTSRTGNAEPTERRCAFVGTIGERDAAEEAPGFEQRIPQSKPIPLEEREALLALYKATGGDHWTHHEGWLGPPGTECHWHGVGCGGGGDEAVNVIAVDLDENNLGDAIPNELGQLKKLRSLNLDRNHLTEAIPGTLGRLENLE
jgi:hypothetical protein